MAADQKIMLHIHDPAILEENTLILVGVSYVSGCVGTKRDKNLSKISRPSYDECVSDSQKYKTDISEIFHDKIWERPPSKRK